MDAFEQCKEQSNVTEFLNLIQSVTSQAWLVIYSLCRDIKKEGLARETGWSHFQLLLKFNMLKFSTIVSSDSPKMDLDLMGFHVYILDKLQLKNETSLTFTNTNEVKKFYYGLLLLKGQSCSSVFDCRALKLVEPEETLMDMLNKATLKAPILDMVESAHEELIFLRAFLMDVLRQQMKLNKYHHLLRNVEETANKLAQVNRFHIEGLISNRLDIVLNCDADVVQHYNMHQGLKDFMKHVIDTNFPKTNGLGCLQFFLGNLEELLSSKLDSVIDWNHQIGSVKEGILESSSFMKVGHYYKKRCFKGRAVHLNL
ncbi:hypothetical protein KY290_026560 [Solanum tuberosum]|uniref:Uncharacterized protein n=1 Tax=Solanum tuberosum TaxID=4113 RepID=A0ABQ7UWT6_SOLTU|nr:hypothetical protein KY290_026560 [Solanum tuberosum]